MKVLRCTPRELGTQIEDVPVPLFQETIEVSMAIPQERITERIERS